MSAVFQVPPRSMYNSNKFGESDHQDDLADLEVGDFAQPKIPHYPYFTVACFAANLGMFIWTMQKMNWSFEDASINPLYGPSQKVLIECGAKSKVLIEGDNQWWRYFSSSFLHVGVIHLFINMLMFVRISRDLEGSFGTRRIALIYIVSGVSGTLASCLFLPTWIGVGSSGALYGLIGAAMADWVHNKDLYANKYCYCLSLVFSAALGLAMGLLPTVDNFANLGGLLAGFLLGLVILPSKVAVGEYQITGCGIFVIVIGAFGLIAWFGVGFYDLYYHNDPRNWCTFCHYLSCLDTPYWVCPPI